MFEHHVNLIRSLAWSFHKTTGIEWKELFSEACLAYCECLRSYNPERSALTTWAYPAMTNALINFCKREKQNKYPHGVEDWFQDSFNPAYEFFEQHHALSQDTKDIIQMVRDNRERYLKAPGRTVGLMGLIKNDLVRDTDWSWERICNAINNLKIELLQDRMHRTIWMGCN